MIEMLEVRHLFNRSGATHWAKGHTAAEAAAESHTRLAEASPGQHPRIPQGRRSRRTATQTRYSGT